MKVWGQISAQITIGEPIQGETQPIIPTLKELLGFAITQIENFAGEFV